MKIELIGPGYIGRSSNIDASRSVNCMLEMQAPGAKTKMSLVSTPGSAYWGTSWGGAAPEIRGVHTMKFPFAGGGDFVFVVNAGILSALDINGNLQYNLATLGTTTGPVIMKDNGLAKSGVGGNQLMIVDGQFGYVYNVSTGVMTSSFPGGFMFTGGGWPSTGANALEYVDGYFIVSQTNSMNAYACDLYNGINWNPLAIAPIQAAPDTIQAIWNVQEQLYFVKQYTTEIFYNNSVATVQGFPFSRMTGAVIDIGCGNAGGSVARQGETLYMLGFKRVNDGFNFYGVVAMKGGTPNVISPQAITLQVQNWYPFSDVISYCYEQDGHSFYVVTSQTANQTFVFDASIPDPLAAWHERSSYVPDSPYRYNRHFSNCYAALNGMHLVGDRTSGNIYQLVSTPAEKIGDPAVIGGQYPLVSTRTCQILADKEGMLRTIRLNRFVLDAEGGSTISPASATLAFSMDGGHNWTADYAANMNTIGQYGQRMTWRRVGTYPYGAIPRITISDPVAKRVLIAAYVD